MFLMETVEVGAAVSSRVDLPQGHIPRLLRRQRQPPFVRVWLLGRL